MSGCEQVGFGVGVATGNGFHRGGGWVRCGHGLLVIKSLRNPAKRAQRRAWPIHAYVGPNGGGKSAAAVWDTLPSLELGRPVLATVRVLDWANPHLCDGCDVIGCELGHWAAHPLWQSFTEWKQLLEAEHCDVIMDEVTGIASSRESQGMPAAVANFLVQLRRRDVVLRWTCPAWARADKVIRECTQAVTYCRGSLPVRSTDDSDRVWRSRRLFRWQTFDATVFEDFTAGKREKIDPELKDLHWGPGSPVFSAYDTFDAVSVIGTVSDSGRCAHCGGRRSAPACSCTDYTARKSRTPRSAGVPDGVGVADGGVTLWAAGSEFEGAAA